LLQRQKIWVHKVRAFLKNIKKPPWSNGINCWIGIRTPPQLGCTGSIPGASSPLPLQLGAEGFAAPAKENNFLGDSKNQPTTNQPSNPASTVVVFYFQESW
jgi:hypothetical protein